MSDVLHIRFAANGNIRKWSREPFEESSEYRSVMTWHPLSTCPENTQVLFGWPDGRRWVGETAIGCAIDDVNAEVRYFCGKGINAFNPDDNPPTRWCEIPAWEKEGE
jgi:hypothetical protein